MMTEAIVNTPVSYSRRRFLQITAAAGVAAGAVTLAGGALAPLLLPAGTAVEHATRTLMGTRIHLTVAAPDSRHALAAIDATFAAMARLVTFFDHRQPTGALALLNHTGVLDGAPPELLEMLQQAVHFGDLTGGAFDVTVKPLLDARSAGTADITNARALVNYRQIQIDGSRVRLQLPGAQVTLDGIAKGRVIDGGVDTLRRSGFEHVLVEAGGDLRTLGTRADGTPWRIGVANPRPLAQGIVMPVLPVTGRAVATSGDYMNSFTTDFSEHHIVDPRTGYSPTELASATVLAATATDADALGTAMVVLGRKAGLALAERLPGVEAVLITKDLHIYTTTGVNALSDNTACHEHGFYVATNLHSGKYNGA